MNQSKILNLILIMAGIIGIIVGLGVLLFPVEFHANSGIMLSGDINLINEMRAAGGPLLVGGVIILLGAFYERLRFTATLMASVLYLSYGCARIVSIVIDGFPSPALIQVTVLEIIIGVICTFAFVYFRKVNVNTHE